MKRLAAVLLIFSFLLPSALLPVGAEESEEIIVCEALEFHALASESDLTPAVLSLPGTGTFSYDDPSYGAQLAADEAAMRAYKALEENLKPGVEEIRVSLSGVSFSDPIPELLAALKAAMSAYIYDHPESQYCSFTNLGYNKTGTIGVYFIAQREDAKDRFEALEEVLEEFKESFDTSLSRMEQYRAIHDKVCLLTSYNDEAAASPSLSEAHTCYGILVDGDDVVCEGYAKAFKVLCDAVDLPCMLISGEADSQGIFTGRSNHMWNAVELDGKWYSVDVTWDDSVDGFTDPVFPGMALSFPQYTYFLNNDYFLEGSSTQDHRASGNIYFASDFPMTFALPAQSEGIFPGSDLLTPKDLQVVCTGGTLALDTLWRYSIAGCWLKDFPRVSVLLGEDTQLSSTLSVPAGKTYILSSAEDQPCTLSHAEGFSGALFSVSGAVEVENIEFDHDPAKPLMKVEEGGSFADTEDLNEDEYVVSSSLQADSASAFQVRYDENGRMLSIDLVGSYDLTQGLVYSLGKLAAPDLAGQVNKRFLLDTLAGTPLHNAVTASCQ